MARARLLHRPIDRLQGLPAALGQNRSEPEFARHPSRHFGASPQATVGRRRRKPLGQPRQKLRAQHARCAPIAPAQVTQGIGPVCVVAGEQLLNPARHEARHRRDVCDRVPPRQKPDHLKVPHRRWIARRPEARLQVLDALPPISFPGRPERWWGDEALKAETDTPQATLEQRHQAAGDVLALRCRGFFSAGALFSRASHIPVETAQ